MERLAAEVHHSSYVDIGHWFWSAAFPRFLRPELAGVPVRSFNHYDSDGRGMRHHLRSSQSRFLVGCAAALHYQHSICVDDSIFYVRISGQKPVYEEMLRKVALSIRNVKP